MDCSQVKCCPTSRHFRCTKSIWLSNLIDLYFGYKSYMIYCLSSENSFKICEARNLCFSFLWVAERGEQIAGFLFEPIQGEAGVCTFLFFFPLLLLFYTPSPFIMGIVWSFWAFATKPITVTCPKCFNVDMNIRTNVI